MDSEKDFPSKLYYILMKKQPLITYNLVGKITYGNNNTYTMMAESHGMCGKLFCSNCIFYVLINININGLSCGRRVINKKSKK